MKIAAPPAERTEPVAPPAIPEPATICAHDPARLCNSDAEAAGVLRGYDDALAEANRRLAWLRDWFAGLGGKGR